MDWDRPVNFEYITTDGQMVINQEANMEMCGGWSRAWTPHSFKIKANKIYEGENYLPYQIFPNKTYLKHKTLQIRNGGNDTGCRIKDAALQEIVHRSGLDVDGQSTQPVAHFINGQYVSMLNMREPNNKHFAYANYGIDTDEMDQFEMSPDSGYVQMEGDREAFLEWYALSANAADEPPLQVPRCHAWPQQFHMRGPIECLQIIALRIDMFQYVFVKSHCSKFQVQGSKPSAIAISHRHQPSTTIPFQCLHSQSVRSHAEATDNTHTCR